MSHGSRSFRRAGFVVAGDFELDRTFEAETIHPIKVMISFSIHPRIQTPRYILSTIFGCVPVLNFQSLCFCQFQQALSSDSERQFYATNGQSPTDSFIHPTAYPTPGDLVSLANVLGPFGWCQ